MKNILTTLLIFGASGLFAQGAGNIIVHGNLEVEEETTLKKSIQTGGRIRQAVDLDDSRGNLHTWILQTELGGHDGSGNVPPLQRAYIQFPADARLSGSIEVAVSGNERFDTVQGEVSVRFSVGVNANGANFRQPEREVVTMHGPLVDHIGIGDPEGDVSGYRIPIYHSGTAFNSFAVKIRAFTEFIDEGSTEPAFSAWVPIAVLPGELTVPMVRVLPGDAEIGGSLEVTGVLSAEGGLVVDGDVVSQTDHIAVRGGSISSGTDDAYNGSFGGGSAYSGDGGSAVVSGGDSLTGNGGTTQIAGGGSTGVGSGGNVRIDGGYSNDGDAGDVQIRAGASIFGSPGTTLIEGGGVYGTFESGGDVLIRGGYGLGGDGKVQITGAELDVDTDVDVAGSITSSGDIVTAERVVAGGGSDAIGMHRIISPPRPDKACEFTWLGMIDEQPGGGSVAAPQRAYIDFGDILFGGMLEITLAGGYDFIQNSGQVSKRFSFMRTFGNAHFSINSSEVSSLVGPVASRIVIGEPESSSSGLRIPIYYLGTAANSHTLKISGLAHLLNTDGIPGNSDLTITIGPWESVSGLIEPMKRVFPRDMEVQGAITMQPQGNISMGVFN